LTPNTLPIRFLGDRQADLGPFGERLERGVGRFLDHDQRNTLIVELVGRTNQPGDHFQAMDDATLAGTGAVLVFLRGAAIRTDEQLKIHK